MLPGLHSLSGRTKCCRETVDRGSPRLRREVRVAHGDRHRRVPEDLGHVQDRYAPADHERRRRG